MFIDEGGCRQGGCAGESAPVGEGGRDEALSFAVSVGVGDRGFGGGGWCCRCRLGVVGHVYVNDNTAGTNTVAGFDRHADGTLTPGRVAVRGRRRRDRERHRVAGRDPAVEPTAATCSPSTPAATRSRCCGSSRTATAAGRGSPVASGGVEPVSIAVHGSLVYVANVGTGGSNYTGFTLNAGGHLRPLSNSTVPLPDGSQPGDVLFNCDGSRLVGTRVNTSLIDSFTVGSDGRLIAAPGSPFPAQGPRPVRERVPADQSRPAVRQQRPRRPRQRHRVRLQRRRQRGSDVDRGIAVPRRPDRALLGRDQPRRPLPVHRQHRQQQHLELHDQRRRVAHAARQHPVQDRLGSAPSTPGSAPTAQRSGSSATPTTPISAFTVNGGNLTELTASPTALPAGAAPFGIVVT